MEERIEQSERILKATTEIDEEVTGDRLQSQFRQLERGAGSTTVDARLLELKQKMGVLPPSPAGSKQIGAGQGGARGEGDEEHVAAELEDSSEEKSGS
jgi:phage shock protein A